jgi:Cu+-exporting ATPase
MTTEKIRFHIPDMHCAGCAQRLSNVLERMEGVRSARVRFDSKQAEIEYDEEKVGFDDMKRTVERTGYSVERRV